MAQPGPPRERSRCKPAIATRPRSHAYLSVGIQMPRVSPRLCPTTQATARCSWQSAAPPPPSAPQQGCRASRGTGTFARLHLPENLKHCGKAPLQSSLDRRACQSDCTAARSRFAGCVAAAVDANSKEGRDGGEAHTPPGAAGRTAIASDKRSSRCQKSSPRSACRRRVVTWSLR
jgi:hypothetical protein